jgi:carbonic anhydrase/acetyltransferase-like protein (isoleucine patch superfamily)
MTSLGLDDIAPRVPDGAWVAANATLVGDVQLSDGASVWYGAVLRADGDRVVVGADSNIQDGAVLHADPDLPVTVGRRASVGHRAVLHGCTVEDDCIVGMGAIVLDNAVIERGSIVGAGALVPMGKRVPAGTVVVGNPFKVIRTCTPQDVAWIEHSFREYVQRCREYLEATGQCRPGGSGSIAAGRSRTSWRARHREGSRR